MSDWLPAALAEAAAGGAGALARAPGPLILARRLAFLRAEERRVG